MIEQGKTCW